MASAVTFRPRCFGVPSRCWWGPTPHFPPAKGRIFGGPQPQLLMQLEGNNQCPGKVLHNRTLSLH